MGDLDDYQLEGTEPPETRSAESESPPLAAPAGPDPEREGAAPPPVKAVVAVIAALVVGAVLYFWFFGRQPSPPEVAPPVESAPTAPRPPARVEGEPIDEGELPSLAASDPLVRRLVAGLSENPQLAAWLVTEDLARRFVVAVDNIAEGVAPRSHLVFLAPERDFAVETGEGPMRIANESFRRYDLLTDVFTSLDTEGSVRLYERLEPLLQQAYVELGYPNRDFRDTLVRALAVIAETPRPPAEMEVVEGVKSFEFADPRLERLSAIEKQLLRLGPRNLERVQAKAAELAAALAAR